MGSSHELLKESVDTLEANGLRGQLLLNIGRSEDVLKVDPLLLADYPLLDHLVESEEVLLPHLGLNSEGDISPHPVLGRGVSSCNLCCQLEGARSQSLKK